MKKEHHTNAEWFRMLSDASDAMRAEPMRDTVPLLEWMGAQPSATTVRALSDLMDVVSRPPASEQEHGENIRQAVFTVWPELWVALDKLTTACLEDAVEHAERLLDRPKLRVEP